MMHTRILVRAVPLVVALGVFAGCDGKSHLGQVGQDGGRAELLSVDLGRVVDVYAYRRIDESVGDRRLRANRRLELIETDVAINPNIEAQSLFDATGQVVPTANYEFRSFDKAVGHEQLVILWDDRPGPEAQSFATALAVAKTGLVPLAAAYRGQNTQTRPIPIVPRNAAIQLTFSSKLSVDEAFFVANPSAIQLLEFKGDPHVVLPVDAFRILPHRVIPKGDTIILDTTILGGEANGGVTSPGLPLSADSVTANIRIALPTRGSVIPTFYVKADGVQQLNDVDSAGRDAVIRDFRSGNLADGIAGRLREPDAPMIVGSLSMGITGIDTVNDVITLNKRLNFVPVRGRYPFVDGPLDASGVPHGPLTVPTQRALRSGDILTQDVVVQLSNGTFETVTLRAEVLRNLEIVTTAGEQNIGKAASPPPGDSGQGELIPVVQVEVATVSPGRDSEGRLVSFRANTTPAGEDCILRSVYIEDVPYTSGSHVSDRDWRVQFVRIEPKPGVPGVDVDPTASVAIEFTKPMDLDQIDNTKNLLITNTASAVETFAVQLTDPKRATARVVPTRLSDLAGDGTVLRLQPPLGFAHVGGQTEPYAVHIRLGSTGVTDLAGNDLEVFDDISNPQDSWSVDFSLAAAANTNQVAWRSWLFEAEDEDGTPAGSVDLFGQYRLEGGRLIGASGVRFGRSANNQNLAAISRINRGECWDPATNQTLLPMPNPPQGWVPLDPANGNAPHPGLLYWTPRMTDSIGPTPTPAPQVFESWQTLAQPVGRVAEPFKPQGSRLQMRYLEDDFSLSYTQPSEFALDVEQLYWSPFNDEAVQFDVFDRFTLALAHARTRPDERWFLTTVAPTRCAMDCGSNNSGLSRVFADNVLPGTAPLPVFEDRVYAINPNQAFRDTDNVKFVPFPRFDRSYTWRDSRLVTVDAAGQVVGLGGAQQPNASSPSDDVTANIDSPWITSNAPAAFLAAGGSIWTQDEGDFVGFRQRDHDPIALPLLVDFKVFADGAANGIASGLNGNQVAMLGPPSSGFPNNPGGYYDRIQSGCNYPNAWPKLRVQATGGVDLMTPTNQILIDPANQLTAAVSNLKDAGLGMQMNGLFGAPEGDGMLHWARADFVRKQSTMTFGFFDTLRPQRWQRPGVDDPGFPDWFAVDPALRVGNLVVQIDPPLARQPAGTSVTVELRGATTFANADRIYDPLADDTLAMRGNLLNANYACEAYRYSTANNNGMPRVAATRLSPYATADELELLRDATTGRLPRYLNPRIVMTNNVDVAPALSPALRSMSIVYRLLP